MKRILVLLIALGILFRSPTVIYAEECEYTEGDLVYIIERGGAIITGYFGSDRTVVIPKEIAGLPVSEIGERAFIDSSVTKIILPDSIMKISEQAIPPNCQVEYEVGVQSVQEKDNPDKEQRKNSERSISENVPFEENSEDLMQADNRKDSDSSSVQGPNTSAPESRSDEDTSTQNISGERESKSKKTDTDSIGKNTTYDVGENNSGRASIDESEITLEDDESEITPEEYSEDLAVQVTSFGNTEPLQSASEHNSSLERSTVTEVEGSDSKAVVHEGKRNYTPAKVATVIIIIGLVVAVACIISDKKGKRN